MVSEHQVILISYLHEQGEHECDSIWCLRVHYRIYRYGNTNTGIFVLSDWCPLCSYLWKSCDNWDNPHPLKQLLKLWLFWQHSSSFITHMQRRKRTKYFFFLFSFNPSKPRSLKTRNISLYTDLFWLLSRNSHLLESMSTVVLSALCTPKMLTSKSIPKIHSLAFCRGNGL